jgi:hypothetical protein
MLHLETEEYTLRSHFDSKLPELDPSMQSRVTCPHCMGELLLIAVADPFAGAPTTPPELIAEVQTSAPAASSSGV